MEVDEQCWVLRLAIGVKLLMSRVECSPQLVELVDTERPSRIEPNKAIVHLIDVAHLEGSAGLERPLVDAIRAQLLTTSRLQRFQQFVQTREIPRLTCFGIHPPRE